MSNSTAFFVPGRPSCQNEVIDLGGNPTGNTGNFQSLAANEYCVRYGGAMYLSAYNSKSTALYFGSASYVFKSIDNAETWSLIDYAGTHNDWPDSFNPLGYIGHARAWIAGTIANKIYHFNPTEPETGGSTRTILVTEFDMDTDTWSPTISVGIGNVTPSLSGTFIPCMAVCNRDSDIILFHNTGDPGGFDVISYSVFDGETWSSQVELVAESEKYCYPITAIADTGGTTHLFYTSSSFHAGDDRATDIEIKHIALSAGLIAGSSGTVASGLKFYFNDYPVQICSRPVIFGGSIHLALVHSVDENDPTVYDITYATAPATLEPTFTTEQVDTTWISEEYYQSQHQTPSAAVCLLLGSNLDIWIGSAQLSTAYVERVCYHTDSAANPKIIYPSQSTEFFTTELRNLIRYTERIDGVWTDPADYLTLEAPNREFIQSITASGTECCCPENNMIW